MAESNSNNDEFNLNSAQKFLVNDMLRNLNKEDPLYRCLSKSKNIEDILKCGATPATNALSIEFNNTKSVNDIDDKNAVWYKSSFDTYASVYEKHLKPNASVPINGLYKIDAPTTICPPTQMKHDGKEYDIKTHPEISRWGVRSNICGASGEAGASWVPDHIAQKTGVSLDEVRCKKLDDFNISNHKDVKTGKYVLAKNYKKVKNQNQKLRTELDQCRKAFSGNDSVCLTEGFEDGNFIEVIDSSKQDYGNFNITNHRQYQNIMQNYVPRKDLETECKNQFGIGQTECKKLSDYSILEHPDIKDYSHNSQCKKLDDYDITKHKDINKYVLRSSVPTKELGEYKISEHPEYENLIKSKDEECNKKLEKYAIKDQCGRITECKKLEQYNIEDHPEFTNYVSREELDNSYPNPSSIYDHPQFDEAVRDLRLADQECARNFLNGKSNSYNKLNVETFENVPQQQQTEQPKQNNSRFSVMNHKDYQYDNPDDGHMPKQECYRKYRDNKIPATAQPEDKCYKNIKDHPDYESELLKFGAVRNACGKIIPPPDCGLQKDQCGQPVCKTCPTSPPPVTESPYKKIDELNEELEKSRLRLEVLMNRYKELLNKRIPSSSPVIKKCKFDIEKELKKSKKLKQIKKKSIVVTNKPVTTLKVNSVSRTKNGWVYKKNEMNQDNGRYDDYNPNGMNYRLLANY